jgi:hypothetical protein
MQEAASPTSRRLLRVLLVRFSEVPTDAAGAWLLRISVNDGSKRITADAEIAT